MNITASWKFKITSRVWPLALDLLHEKCDDPARLFAQKMAVSSKVSISENTVFLSVN